VEWSGVGLLLMRILVLHEDLSLFFFYNRDGSLSVTVSLITFSLMLDAFSVVICCALVYFVL